jgi:hypothetical protein
MMSYYGELFKLMAKYNHKDLEHKQLESLGAIINMFGNNISNKVI